MAYEARKNDADQAQQDAESNAANQKATKAGLKAVSNTGGWWGAIAKAVDKADDVTGGKITEAAGKGLTKANKVAPLGNTAQKATNKIANSKLGDKAYEAANARSGSGAASKAANTAGKAAKAKEGVDKAKAAGAQAKKELPNQAKKGGENKNSLPSSGGGKNTPPNKTGQDTGAPSSEEEKEKEETPKEESPKKDDDKATNFMITGGLAPILLGALPILGVIFIIMIFLSFITNFSDYEDAFGVSQVAGLDTGGLNGTVSDPNQKAFYERIMDVKNSYQKNGKNVDPLMIVSVYHALNTYDANITYNSMSKGRIERIADAMFSGNAYSETTFKSNLKSSVIPTYLPFASSATKDSIVKEVFDYIERYYSLIGKKNACSSIGSCTYAIDGFYIEGSNFKKELNVNDLYVRLMQCGTYNGHDAGGQWGMPLEDEELIPFEKYILGVAYQEIGVGAPEQAFKAQMIAARSYILARPTQMGSATSWRKLEQENGKWILQVASCTADQVYCDPDKGCSAENGDGQWKQVHSGTDHGRTIKGPLDEDHPARRYAAEVQGETLVNDQGYIVLTNFTDVESKEFISLANSGLDYKQIMMQVYSNKYPGAGTLNISKADCGICANTNDYVNWKQYEGEWVSVQLGNSGKTIRQIGCLATSLAIQIAKSGVQTNIGEFNPGTFVEYLNGQNAFSDGGALLNYSDVELAAPGFKYQGFIDVLYMSKEEKLNTIAGIVNQAGVYAVAEVKGETGQHWVAIDSVSGDTIKMMDPGSSNTDMWDTYDWYNTSRIVYYKVG